MFSETFLPNVHVFHFFHVLLHLLGPLILYWLFSVVMSGHPFYIPHFRRKAFILSLLSMMLAVGFSWVEPFIRLRKFPFIPSLLAVLIMKSCWILSNAFSVSTEIITWFSFLFYWYDDWLILNVKPTLPLWDKTYLVKTYFLYVSGYMFLYASGFSLLVFGWGLLCLYS